MNEVDVLRRLKIVYKAREGAALGVPDETIHDETSERES